MADFELSGTVRTNQKTPKPFPKEPLIPLILDFQDESVVFGRAGWCRAPFVAANFVYVSPLLILLPLLSIVVPVDSFPAFPSFHFLSFST